MQNWTTRTVLGLTLAGVLALTGCAPEGTNTTGTLEPGQLDPATSRPGSQGGSGQSGSSQGSSAGQSEDPSANPSQGSDGSSTEKQPTDVATDDSELLGDIEGRVPVEVDKTTSLPRSFPTGQVPVPDDADIDNVGERADGTWFIVLRFDTMKAAEEQIATLTRQGDFVVDEREPLTREGFERTLTSDHASVHAYGYVDEVGPVVSLDITITP